MRPELGGRTLDVDTGFIVHNDRTYPTLLRLFSELGVETQESDMSMSVRCDESGLEYAGAKGARGLFPRAANLRSPRYLRMLGEVRRFHREARALLAVPHVAGDADETLRAFVARVAPSTTRRATSSSSSTTTACSPCSARPRGERSWAARRGTSSALPLRSTRCAWALPYAVWPSPRTAWWSRTGSEECRGTTLW